MKKLLFLILFISLSFLGHSQYNITQNLGGPTTLVQNPNYGGFRGGLIPYTFSDTTSANGLATSLKLYNGALIYCTADNAVYWRDATNQKWVQLLPSGGTGGLSAWLTTGNFAVPTDVNGYAKFGTFGTNGINVITSGNTVFKIHADGIVPDTGTVQGLGVNSYGELSYFSGGGGSTPTWQQTLTAGSTLNISNSINSGNNTQSFSWPTLGGGNLGMYISSESSTAATGGEILLQVTTTHTPVATGITTYSADIQNSSIGTNLTNIALMAGATEGATNIAAWFNRGKVRFGTSGTESGILDIVGATSGTITFQPQSAAGTYNWNWPTTAGTSGYLLTSGGGGSTAMTWTNPSSLGFANTALSNLSSVAINTSLLPGTDDGAALGSTSKEFSDLFLASGGVINWANGNTTLTQTSGSLTLGGAFYATSSVAAGTYLYGGDKYNTYTGYTGAVLGGITTHAVLDFVDNNSRIGEFYTDASNFNFFTDVSKGIVFYVNNSFTAPALQFSSAGALRLGYLGAGALTADASGNITSVSDERLKNIEGGYGVGLSQVYKINPIVYKWKPETKLDSLNSYIGFSAQNIEYALGENAVGINRDGYKSIQDRAILAALTNSIKELKDLNDSQQKEIDDLKKEVKKLKRL